MGPKQGKHTPGLVAPTPCMPFVLRNQEFCLFLCKHCLHFKSLETVTTRYLILSTFSRNVPSKEQTALTFLIRFLVSCIMLHFTGWSLIPHSWPICSIDQYPFWVSMCLQCYQSDDSWQSHQRTNESYHDVIYIQGKQQWAENGALRHTRQNRCPLRFCSIDYNPLLPIAQKWINPY